MLDDRTIRRRNISCAGVRSRQGNPMRLRLTALSIPLALLSSTSLKAQTATNNADVWQNGGQPLTGLYSARQLPNSQPTAPSRPANGSGAPNPIAAAGPQTPGIAWAGGTLYTGITAGTFYDDNVFASHSNPRSDTAFIERPEFSWVTQGQNYTFATSGFIEGREYARFESENQVNGSFGAGFTVTPADDTQVIGNARYIHGHLDRGASDTIVNIPGIGSTILDTQFNHPVSYDEGIQSIALNKRWGNWWGSLGGAGLEIQYQNPTISNPLGNTTVDLAYADGGIGAVNGRIGYVIAPQTSIFVEAAGNTRDWGVNYFNSTGYRVVGGMLFEQGPGAVMKGEIWAGYMGQDYNGFTMNSVSSWTFGLGLSAALGDQLTAVFEGHREAKEAALSLAALPSGEIGASNDTCAMFGGAICVSAVETQVGTRLDYRVLPNVVVGAGVTYLQLDYDGFLAFDRIDRSLSPLASIKYFPLPNVTVGFDYRNLAFSSSGGTGPLPFTNVSALSYNRNVYLLSLNAKW
jgi:hypothetical protein